MRSRGRGRCEDKSRGTQARVALPPRSEGGLERARQVQARAVTKAESGEGGRGGGESSGGLAESADSASDPWLSTAVSLGPHQACLCLGAFARGLRRLEGMARQVQSIVPWLFTLDGSEGHAAAHRSTPARCAARRPGSHQGHGRPGT